MKRERIRWIVLSTAVLTLATIASSSDAQLLKLPSTRSAKKEALQAIPFAEINPQMQQTIRKVTTKPTIHRRLPVESIECDPNLYLFLLRNPEVVVNIWDLMGATQISMTRTGDYTYYATDGVGTTSSLQLAYGNSNVHVFYGEGRYEGSLIKNAVDGRCVLVLQSDYEQLPSGKTKITNTLDMFLEVDNLGLDVLAKTFQPFFGKYADYNFLETARFISRLSATAEENGAGVQRLASRLIELDPAVRQQFAAVAASVSQNAASRQQAIPVAARMPYRGQSE